MKLHDLQKQFMKMIAPTRAVDPELRLQIYRDSSLGARLKALSKVFNGTARMVGEQFFAQMATEFLKQQPSRQLTADAQGQQFPEFIATYTAAASVPYLSDLAQFEWLWYHVFHGAPNIPQYMQSNYPVTQIWEMCQPEYKGDFVLTDLAEPLHVMLVQREQRIYWYHLS